MSIEALREDMIVRAEEEKRRDLLAMMAAQIAGPMSDPRASHFAVGPLTGQIVPLEPDQIAGRSVEIARAILAEIDAGAGR